MPKYYRTIVERNIDSSKDENTLKISTDDPTVTKMTLNDKEIKSGTYTRKLSDGTLVSSNPTTVVKEDVASNKTAVAKEEKVVKADDKKVVVEKEEDKRTFWQRHPVLRVLLTIFLCLLLIGLLMIAAYHIMNAVNNAKKNDKIDDAKKADEEIKNNKDKLTDEQKEKLEKGELKSEDVQKDLDKEVAEAKDADNVKEQFDKYKNATDDKEKTAIAENYTKSQVDNLKNGKLDVKKLEAISAKESNDVKIAEDTKSDSFDNLTKNNDLTSDQANQLKDGKELTVLSDTYKTDYKSYKDAVDGLKNNFKDGSTIQDIIDGKITATDTAWTEKQQNAFNAFATAKDNDDTIILNTTNLTEAQKTAIHNGTFDVTKDNKFVASEQQQSLIDDYNAKAADLLKEQNQADYAKNRYEYANTYATATDDKAKSAALTNFQTLEKEAISTNNEKLSDYVNDQATAEQNDVTQTQSLLDNVKNIEDNQKILNEAAGKEGATLDDAQSAIEADYGNKFPKSDGAFRIAGDATAAAGAAGLIGTGIAALIAKSGDKNKKTVVKQNVDNGRADNNIKTVTQTTNTVIK